jgi:hypothetical protein
MRFGFWRRPLPTFVRAVHYFGSAHPSNFWDTAPMAEVPGLLAQIREDGFNTVILAVPWRGFQRRLFPPTYDALNLARLGDLLAAIDAAGLASIVRVCFPWHNDPDSELSFDERALGLFTRDDVRAAWLDYLRVIRDITARARNFRFAFFSWEDLPSIRELMIHRTQAERHRLAGPTGYRDFLCARHALPEVSELFGENFNDASEIYIPLPDCAAYVSYSEFVNRRLNDLLAFGRTVWPGLSMQIRADHDRVVIDGEVGWIENDIRADDPSMRVSYYFPYMYAQNCGETLSADQALANMRMVMDRLSANGANPNHVLDQLVYWDESPQFQHWAKIEESQIPRFLLGAVDILKALSRGYGLWNYLDYRVNHLYNANFLRGLHGWAAHGEVWTRFDGESVACAVLAPGARISQRMVPYLRGYGAGLYPSVSFRALCASTAPGRLRLSTNGVAEAEIALSSGRHQASAQLPPDPHRSRGEIEFTIENTGECALELAGLCLWGAVYRSRIYDEDGRPGRFLAHVRAMNRR